MKNINLVSPPCCPIHSEKITCALCVKLGLAYCRRGPGWVNWWHPLADLRTRILCWIRTQQTIHIGAEPGGMMGLDRSQHTEAWSAIGGKLHIAKPQHMLGMMRRVKPLQSGGCWCWTQEPWVWNIKWVPDSLMSDNLYVSVIHLLSLDDFPNQQAPRPERGKAMVFFSCRTTID